MRCVLAAPPLPPFFPPSPLHSPPLGIGSRRQADSADWLACLATMARSSSEYQRTRGRVEKGTAGYPGQGIQTWRTIPCDSRGWEDAQSYTLHRAAEVEDGLLMTDGRLLRKEETFNMASEAGTNMG